MERMNQLEQMIRQGKEKRQEIYDFMLAYENEHGHAPAVRVICEALDNSSTSNVLHHQQIMVKDGMLEEVAPKGYPYRLRVVREAAGVAVGISG